MYRKALVVDDDEMNRSFFNTLLTKKFKIKVSTANDGLEALEELRKGGIDIIFLDISMPNMDGISFLKVMREDPLLNHTPVVVISANNQRDVVKQLIGLGVIDYILKPLEFGSLNEKLSELLLEND